MMTGGSMRVLGTKTSAMVRGSNAMQTIAVTKVNSVTILKTVKAFIGGQTVKHTTVSS